ncbi:unnamed protein product [Phaeothamnion confervicola]
MAAPSRCPASVEPLLPAALGALCGLVLALRAVGASLPPQGLGTVVAGHGEMRLCVVSPQLKALHDDVARAARRLALAYRVVLGSYAFPLSHAALLNELLRE